MYEYKAKITQVYDGDSITADIDMGFKIFKQGEKLRLMGIDTPELRGSSDLEKAKAKEARDHLRTLILDETVTIRTYKSDKYGRYLCEVFDEDGVNINQHMISRGYARPYTGGKKEPWIFN
jgi:micrococcal nuclease